MLRRNVAFKGDAIACHFKTEVITEKGKEWSLCELEINVLTLVVRKDDYLRSVSVMEMEKGGKLFSVFSCT